MHEANNTSRLYQNQLTALFQKQNLKFRFLGPEEEFSLEKAAELFFNAKTLSHFSFEFSRFHLFIEARDGGDPVRVRRAPLVVYIDDVNDNAPDIAITFIAQEKNDIGNV